jgi:hypothetical protein
MRNRLEYVTVPLPEDEGQNRQADQLGESVDIYNTQLGGEEIEMDPEADAFAEFVTLKVAVSISGEPISISTIW